MKEKLINMLGTVIDGFLLGTFIVMALHYKDNFWKFWLFSCLTTGVTLLLIKQFITYKKGDE